MKILYIVPYVPNQIRVRPYQLIRALCRRNHEITLATLWSSDEEYASLADIERECACVIAHRLSPQQITANLGQALFASMPLQAAYCWQPKLAAALATAVRDKTFDVVHVEHLRGASYGLHLRNLTHKPNHQRLPIVWDSVDCISSLFSQAAQRSRSLASRLITTFDLNRTRRYEGQLVHKFDRVLVTSNADRQALQELARRRAPSLHDHRATEDARIEVLRNGVDLDYFTPSHELRAKSSIVFSGKMSYHANVAAALHLAREIMPLVWATHPNTRLYIVGKDPAPAVRALAAAKTGDRRIVVTGTVPDIRPFLQRATLAVAPLPYGTGIQNKVLEAMACATPVVAGPQAVSALDCEPGCDLLVADHPASFAEKITTLIDHPESAARLGSNGRSYVERYHAWPSAASALESLYVAAREERHYPEQVTQAYASSY